MKAGADGILKNQDRIKANYQIDPNRGQLDAGWDMGRQGGSRTAVKDACQGLNPEERRAFRAGYAAGSSHHVPGGERGGTKPAPKPAPSPSPRPKKRR